MNEVSSDEFQREVSLEGYEELILLTWFLFARRDDKGTAFPADGGDWTQFIPQSFRWAPSIVVRSEAELYGISTPRFGMRVNFLDAGNGAPGSFVNFRRLRTLHDFANVANRMAPHRRRNRLDPSRRHPLVADQRKRTTEDSIPLGVPPAVADAVLIPPSRLHLGDFQFVRTPLFVEHGEALCGTPGSPTPLGVPYVMHSWVGGGLCAQACCFMATSSLCGHATRTGGLGEITALASAPQVKEMLIFGLDEVEMARYFESVGLGGISQFRNPLRSSSRHEAEARFEYALALEAYAASNMPVILFVDINRLSGPGGIYESNGLQAIQSGGYSYHAVLVVGCSRRDGARSANGEPVFLFNDPATMPFIEATLAQLGTVGTPPQPANSGCLPWAPEVPETMRYPAFMSVTPAAVKLPLLCSGAIPNWEQANGSGSRPRGLIELSRWDRRSAPDPETKRFLLAQVGSIRLLPHRHAFSSPDRFREVNSLIGESRFSPWAERNLAWGPEHWIWLEFGPPDRVRIWDAQQPPPDGTEHSGGRDSSMLLRAVVVNDGTAMHIVRVPRGVLDNPEAPPHTASLTSARSGDRMRTQDDSSASPPLARQPVPSTGHRPIAKLRPALLTSCDINGGSAGMREWPEGVEFVEAYVCMSQELDKLLPGMPPGRRPPVQVFADAWRNQEQRRLLAQELASGLRNTLGNRTLVGFATFLPELLAPSRQVAHMGKNALRFLLEVAACVYDPVSRNRVPVFNVELVAGSRIFGVWPAISTDPSIDGAYCANRLDQGEALWVLISRLRGLARHASGLRGIQLAVELEPGPLFALNEQDALVEFCKLVAQLREPEVRRVIGLNFDLAHWAFLSRIEREWLLGDEGESVRRRIVHAHISDHHPTGHFCDLAIETVHSREVFKSWCEFLRLVADESPSRPDDCPRFSGFVSLEMEACKSREFLNRSYSRLQELLAST